MEHRIQHDSFQGPFQDTNSCIPSSSSLEQLQGRDSVPSVMMVEWALKYKVVFHSIYKLSYKLDPTLFKETVRVLLSRHDILRARITTEQERIQLCIPPVSESVPFTFISLSSLPKSAWKAALAHIGIDAYHEISRGEGHLLQFIYFDGGSQESDLLMILIHHAITDMYSNQILLKDFQTIYFNLAQNKGDVPPLSKSISFKIFAEKLISYVQSHQQREVSYWFSLPWDQLVPLPKEEQTGATARADERQAVTLSLSVEETKLLLRIIPRYNFSVFEVLLTALGLTVAEWIGDPHVAIMAMDFGRLTFSNLLGGIDLLYTIGFIAATQVLFLHMGDAHEPFVALKAIRSQLRMIPHQGIGLHLLQTATSDKALSEEIKKRMINPCQAVLNYMGRQDAVFSHDAVLQLAEEYSEVQSLIPGMQLPENAGPRTVHCVAEIHQGQFWFHLKSMPENNYTYDTIEEKAHIFLQHIKSMLFALTHEQRISNRRSELMP